jgi:hypothetical protein
MISTNAAEAILIGSSGATGVTITPNTIVSGTLSAGAAGFSVDADGDVTGKSFTASKASGVAGDMGLYEANSTDTDAAGFRGPLSLTGNTSYRGQFPNAKATSANMVLAWDGSTTTAGDGTPGNPYVQAMSFVDLDGYATLTGSETLTNKTLTAPIITNPEVDGSVTADWTALPAKVSGTMIHNCGQAGVAATLTLPTAAYGYSFVATVCEPSLTGTWKFLCSGTDHMTVDEVKGKHYVERLTTKVEGDSVTCWTAKRANDGVSSSATLAIATATDDVKNAAFKFVISGVGYDKAPVDGTALTGANIPQAKYGGWAFQIGADGTIDVVESADNATGYDSSALAIDAIPAVAPSHVRMGTITASKSDAVFIPATTLLGAANVTTTIASTAVHAYGYGWNCKSGKTSWTTD